MGFLLSIAGNGLGLYLAQRVIENFVFTGGYMNYLTAGFILAGLNLILKPILKTITFPFIIITLGLFIFVINAFLLWLTDYIFDFMAFETTASLIFTTILIGFINLIIGIIHKISG